MKPSVRRRVAGAAGAMPSSRVTRALAALLGPVALAAVPAACSSSDEAAAPTTGAAIYRQTCATCHGRNGGGFVGPSLVDAAERYPNVADEIALVTNGKAQMPSFGGRLSAEQIATVVEYTRAEFTTAPSTSTTTSPIVGPTTPPS